MSCHAWSPNYSEATVLERTHGDAHPGSPNWAQSSSCQCAGHVSEDTVLEVEPQVSQPASDSHWNLPSRSCFPSWSHKHRGAGGLINNPHCAQLESLTCWHRSARNGFLFDATQFGVICWAEIDNWNTHAEKLPELPFFNWAFIWGRNLQNVGPHGKWCGCSSVTFWLLIL